MSNSSSASQLTPPGSKSILTSPLSVFLLFLGFNYTLMGTVIYPALPGLQERFHLSAAQLSLMASLPALVSLSLQPVAGWVSDRMNRKPVILLGLLAYAVGGLLVVSVLGQGWGGYFLVLVGRSFSGLGELGAFPHYLAIIHQKFPAGSRQRVLGWMESVTSLGSVLAPVVGGTLVAMTLELPFLASAGFALLALALAVVFIPNLKSAAVGASRTQPRARERFRFHFSYLGAALVMGTLVAMHTFLGSYSSSLFGLDSMKIGLMLAIAPLAMAVGAIFAGKNGEHQAISTHTLVWLGLLAVSGLALLGFAPAPWVAAVGLIAVGLTLGYWLTVFDHDAMHAGSAETRGLRLGLFQQNKALGILLVPFLLGVVIDQTGSIRLIYYLLAGMVLSVGGVLLFLRSAQKGSLIRETEGDD